MGEQVSYSISEAIEDIVDNRTLSYFDQELFGRVMAADAPAIEKTYLFADMARFNTLYMIARAGSGHLGSSFSSLDIMSWIYTHEFKEGDRFFSSKGHDSPGLYSVQTALDILPFDKLHGLRRLNGLPGHPDVHTPGSVTNTGSLGMGISKAKGFLFADQLKGNSDSRVFVLTGDGELQEGQFWESLISAANHFDERLIVIVDHNKIQSDTYVKDVSDLGDLVGKFKSFGWSASEGDGHDLDLINEFIQHDSQGKPKIFVAHTVKGKGVSFMEHTSMSADQEYYTYHSGAPNEEDYLKAKDELLEKVHTRAAALGVTLDVPKEVDINTTSQQQETERLILKYSDYILEEAKNLPELVALDADLILDTGLIEFKNKYPERFVECGIAEQDMVSQAGTMALAGLTPIVHSFSCFLTSRASEQIYNNCSQESKVIYAGSLAGLLPAGPGHSHQAVRDVAAMSAMPGMTIIEPVNSTQLERLYKWAVRTNTGSTYLRLTSIPIPILETSTDDEVVVGRGEVVHEGDQLALIVSSPIMTDQALKVAAALKEQGISLKVISTPWLNRMDADWYADQLSGVTAVATLENHYSEMGMGCYVLSALSNAGILQGKKSLLIGLDELPACGQQGEVLRHHGLDVDSLVQKLTDLA